VKIACALLLFGALAFAQGAKTDAVLKAVKDYRQRLKNPESMQLRTAYLTDEGAACLEIGSQNGFGGMSVSRVVYITSDWKGAKRLRNHWLDESGMGGSASSDAERISRSGFEVDRWPHVCMKRGAMLPGTDLTAKVKAALNPQP
jgi:hypothetical protein